VREHGDGTQGYTLSGCGEVELTTRVRSEIGDELYRGSRRTVPRPSPIVSRVLRDIRETESDPQLPGGLCVFPGEVKPPGFASECGIESPQARRSEHS
jgi:hypothetical protein